MSNREINFLDETRKNEGNEALKKKFQKTFWENRAKALDALNDEQLTFPTLYVLLPEIIALRLFYNLGARNSIAYFIIKEINQVNANSYYLSYKNNETQKVLKWILITGGKENAFSPDYYQVLDVCASVLLNTYEDLDMLPLICDMIFIRTKEGRYVNDLVWAFFQCKDPLCLKLIAEHLCANDNKENLLAAKLLNLKEEISENDEDKEKAYNRYLQWLNNNDPYLYFTEESNQYSSEPVLVDVDLERKYLHKGVSSYIKEPLVDLDDNEKQCISAFGQLSESEKFVLAEYSNNLYEKDNENWKEWIKQSVNEQVKEASSLTEGGLL